jgi:hypothetical membrane protein
MKKSISTISLIALIATLAGTLFKYMHWPGASILFISGHFLFIVAAILWLTYKRREFYLVMVGLAFISLFVMGAFMTMKWPGASIVTTVALIITLLGAYSLFSKK